MNDMPQLYDSLRHCDECVDSSVDCEHYQNGWVKGAAFRNAQIIDWIERHRTIIEIGDDSNITRDHFSSDDLIAIIKSSNYNDFPTL